MKHRTGAKEGGCGYPINKLLNQPPSPQQTRRKTPPRHLGFTTHVAWSLSVKFNQPYVAMKNSFA
jgi:hypothetical protein